ncbi:MAG: VWA domain-containing protein, partial [Pseudomonadota bacterium]
RMRGREQVGDEDIAIAVRLSLLNRATQMPEQIEEEANSAAEAEPDDENQTESLNENDDLPPDELDVETLLANLPSSLLSQLQGSVKKSQRTKQQGRRGQMRKDGRRGRPLTSRRGRPRSGHRLDILSTLRAAAPWQKLRSGQDADQDNLRVYASDFHVKRFRQPTETTTIFLVDASGSTAINRLGEAKGAIERLLAESYSARDNVALIAFRKEGAQLLLPPTRSLTRVKRSLAVLPGGGGTPLAAGLRAALQLAEQESRSGRSVTMALLTDGNANVTLDGIGNRATANEEAMQVAREISNCGHACLLIDINKLPNPRAKTLSEVMGADYLPMPFTGSQNLARAICAYRG